MTLWLVRAGRAGEREQLALNQGLAVIGWDELPDLASLRDRAAFEQLMRETYADQKPNAVTNWTGQIWAFRDRIQVGDLVILPLKMQSALAVGKVIGPYAHRPDLPIGAQHTRPVEWIRTDIPRSAIDQDLLYSLGAFMTVCQIRRNQAESRIRAVVEGKAPPVAAPTGSDPISDAEETAQTDLEVFAADQIRAHIIRKFKGHGLARVVAGILEAQGFHTVTSPPGADGGVDVIAGGGPLGFDPPRICVQVKSGDDPVDAKEFRELQGVMKTFGADQAMLVSWGGFKHTARAEARRTFFHIRLWDAGALVSALQQHYDRLSPEIQAEIPLKRVWALVLEE